MQKPSKFFQVFKQTNHKMMIQEIAKTQTSNSKLKVLTKPNALKTGKGLTTTRNSISK